MKSSYSNRLMWMICWVLILLWRTVDPQNTIYVEWFITMETQITGTTQQIYTLISTRSGMTWMTQGAQKPNVSPTQRVLIYSFMKKSNDLIFMTNFYLSFWVQCAILNWIRSESRRIIIWLLLFYSFHVFWKDIPEVPILFLDDFIENTHLLCEHSHHLSRKFAILNKINAKIVIFWSLLQKLLPSLQLLLYLVLFPILLIILLYTWWL